MTAKRHPANERVKRRYLQFLADVKGRDETSLDAVAKALERFDDYNRRRDFKKFHIEQARGFKAHLMEQRNVRTGAPLSASTINSTLAILKAFFIWLAGESEYRSSLKYADAEYFNPPENLARIASAHRHRPCPTLDQIRIVLDAMPTETEIQRRDRALVAFAILTGARDSAIVSFKLKHIDLEHELLEQDARDVQTKRAKTFSTWFFPVGDDVKQIVVDWVCYLRQEKQFGPADPIFPKSRVEPGPNLHFVASGLDRAHWANAHPVRALFKDAFAQVGLPYFNPHSFRNTLVQLAYELKLDAEQFKAWSQNLGHEHCLTTFSSYGHLPPHRQAEIIRGLAKPANSGPGESTSAILRQLADELERGKKSS
ncbi:tyrosine-type recombinase/integrase [Rhodoblastus sp. 17X3]|uniref:tyrosine-type recombinase/integrase n=1 Tax=Rhodoblastus sp. 17X3 TaxID=3047026 RepID=UPI0024B800E6|nr:tyrosine-type recombinase/integrase [Rhodoblastus sp. 17X3]MDI9847317.1 tyrosine-type recombinase/integrase [Rhodoblastus sp. 17X3]